MQYQSMITANMSCPTGWQSWISASSLGKSVKTRTRLRGASSSLAQTGSGIISSLDKATTWEEAKETLLTRLGIGSVRDEPWAALKNLKKGAKDIVELAGEAEKLAKRLHPRDEEAAERHSVDAFLGALEKTLAAEVTETRPSDYGGRRCSRSANRENLGGAVRLQGGMPNQHYAGPDPDPEERPQGGKRADRRSQSQCSNRGRHGRYSRAYHINRRRRSCTACCSRSPHLPGLRRGT